MINYIIRQEKYEKELKKQHKHSWIQSKKKINIYCKCLFYYMLVEGLKGSN